MEALVEKYKLSFKVADGSDARVFSAVPGVSSMTIRLSPGSWLCPQSRRPDRESVYSAVWVWSATSNLRRSSEEQRQIKWEVNEWRNHL
jgi:hypothetical protein